MKKFIAVVLLVLCLLAVLFFIGKDMIVKKTVEQAVLAVTGLPLEIEKLKISLHPTRIEISNLRLFNQPDFTDRLMLGIPEIYVDYDFPAILKREIHLREIRLYVKEFLVVKTADGKLNLDSLKALQAARKDTERVKGKTGPVRGSAFALHIDSLELKIGKVVYKEYATSGSKRIQEFPINLDERYENITDIKSLVNLLVFRALANTTIASLANLDIHNFKSGFGEALQSVRDITTGTVGIAEDTLKTTAGTLKKIIGLPFGK